MKRIVSPSDMKAWDQSCISNGISSLELMIRAANGIKDEILSIRGDRFVTCLCGSGNNGGDGIALAWLLKKDDVPVRIILLAEENRLTSDSVYYLNLAKEEKVPVFKEWDPVPDEIIVDAIFGIGLNREVTGSYAKLINDLNSSGKIVISADIPSGLHALTGSVLGTAVKATITVTMQFIKSGMLLNQGPSFSGNIRICTLSDHSEHIFENEMLLQEDGDIVPLLPPRPFDSHKGKNGHALLCVGSPRYTGAALLSSRSCLRAGCGILSVCTPDQVRPFFRSLPEAITIPIGSEDWNHDSCATAVKAFSDKSAIGIGCGLDSGDTRLLLSEAIKSKIPLVIDADGLNALSKNRDLIPLLHQNIIITPHLGEMARLLNCKVQDVAENPLKAVNSFSCTVLLKGPTTLVSDGLKTVFCTEGSPALAKGGSGDVLTGIITALLAQGLSAFDAARTGTYILGTTAKNAMKLLSERMLLASDIIDLLEQETYE